MSASALKSNMDNQTTCNSIVDCKGLCFFCLRNDKQNKVGVGVERGGQRSFSLLDVAQFLGMNLSDLEKKSSSLSSSKKMEMQKSSNSSSSPAIAVPVCEQCSVSMEEFIELYRTLQMTKLRLSEWAHKTWGVMKAAEAKETNESGKGKSREKSTGGKDLMEILREETLSKCAEKFHSTDSHSGVVPSTPAPIQIKTERHCPDEQDLQVNDEFMNVSVMEVEEEDYLPRSIKVEKSPTDSSSLQQPKKKRIPPVKPKGNQKPKPLPVPENLGPRERKRPARLGVGNNVGGRESEGKLKSKSNKVSASKQPPNKKIPRSCTYCRIVLMMKPDDWEGLTKHLVSDHCEHYFEDIKLPTLTDLQFKKILVDLLFKRFDGGTNPLMPNCTVCWKKFGGHQAMTSLKIHLVRYHMEKLREEVIRIQNDPGLEEKLKDCNPNGELCPCGVYLDNRPKMLYHKREHCNLSAPKFKESVRMRQKKTEAEKMARRRDRKARRLRRDQGIYTSDEDEEEGGEPGPAQETAPAVDNPNPPTPNQVKKEQLEQNDNLQTIEAQALKDNLMISRSSLDLDVPQHSANKYDCPYCLAKNMAPVSKRQHMMNYHCEHWFPNLRAGNISPQQFQKILSDLLFKDIVSRPKLSFSANGDGEDYTSRPNLKCVVCSRLFLPTPSSFIEMKLHLIMNHYEFLTERLRNIQEDPELEEKLSTANPEGLICPCGVYISSERKQSMHYQRSHCKVVKAEEWVKSRPKNRSQVKKCKKCGDVMGPEETLKEHYKTTCWGRRKRTKPENESETESKSKVISVKIVQAEEENEEEEEESNSDSD